MEWLYYPPTVIGLTLAFALFWWKIVRHLPDE
jgi:hypothetical protein